MWANWINLIVGIIIIIAAFVPALQGFWTLLVLGILVAILAFLPLCTACGKAAKK